jgi:hypothetical protein
MVRMMTQSEDWWTSIRTTAFFKDAEPVEAEPQLDPAAIELADWAEHREQLGLGRYDTGDFIGVDRDQASGMPSWQHPVGPPEPEPTDLDLHAINRQGVIPDTSDVFQAAPPRPRRNPSPYRTV